MNSVPTIKKRVLRELTTSQTESVAGATITVTITGPIVSRPCIPPWTTGCSAATCGCEPTPPSANIFN
jgi:hypothetical protein